MRTTPRTGPYDLPRSFDLRALRFVASVGEPLNPEAVVWGRDVLGLPVHDNWWQTETGAIMIANFAGCDIRPGSMGRPLPGVEAAVLRRGEDGRAQIIGGRVTVLEEPGVEELALRPGWLSMFRGYLHDQPRTAAAFADGRHPHRRSGATRRRRSVPGSWGAPTTSSKSAGHLIGDRGRTAVRRSTSSPRPGSSADPDPVAGNIVKAFVALRPGFDATTTTRQELLAFAVATGPGRGAARDRLRPAPAAHPQWQGHAPPAAGTRELGLPKAAPPLWRRPSPRTPPPWRGRSNPTSTARTTHAPRPATRPNRRAAHRLALFESMLRVRRFEERCVELYSAARIREFMHLYIGEEAVAVGVNEALTDADAVVLTYREHGHALARGVPAEAIMAEMFGKVTGSAVAGADPCTCSTPARRSTAATRSSAAGSLSRPASPSPTA